MAGIAMHRYRMPWLPLLVLTPVAMPEILLGVSLLLFFRQVLDLTLGLFSILVAHITFSIGFVAVIVRARLAGMDEGIFEAARDLGATPWMTFRRVTLPLILPALVAGFLMSFTLSIDDFVITFFVAGVGVTTLPLQIYSMIKVAVTPEVNADVDAPHGADADAGPRGHAPRARHHAEGAVRALAAAAAGWRCCRGGGRPRTCSTSTTGTTTSATRRSPRFEAQLRLPPQAGLLLGQRGDARQAGGRARWATTSWCRRATPSSR